MKHLPAANRNETLVRPIQLSDIRHILRLIDSAWRVHLRISPLELEGKLNDTMGVVAEDQVGLRGFMLMEPLHPELALLVGVALRDTWHIEPFFDLLLPETERMAADLNLPALASIGHAIWLNEALSAYGFATKDWIVAYERLGTDLPSRPGRMPARLRTAHRSDLPALLKLDQLAFGPIWFKSQGSFNEALATAISFNVAVIDQAIVAFAWCELHDGHAHLTRLAVHPSYQRHGIGSQLLYKTISDVLTAGANQITLNTQQHNYRSQALYQRFGFVDTQQRMPVLWKDLGYATTRP